MTRTGRACAVCGAWNHVDVVVCPACGTKHPGRQEPREQVFNQYWQFTLAAG